MELAFLGFKRLNASQQLRSACRLPPKPSVVRGLHAQPRRQKPQSQINGFFLACKPAVCQPLNASNAYKASWNAQPSWHAQPRMQKLPQGQINAFLWAFKAAVCQPERFKCFKSLLERTTAQAKATPTPHQCLLMGVQACRSPGVTRFKPLKRLNILLACPTPQPTGTPRPHQWLLMGVQACRLPGLKPFKPLKPLKPLKSFLARPTPQAKATPTGTPRPHQWLLMDFCGRSSLPFARP